MTNLRKRKWPATLALGAMLGAQMMPPLARADYGKQEGGATSTPIKHLIVLIGENRSFDNTFGTYIAKHDGKTGNLLSRGIVDQNGAPGTNSKVPEQFSVNTPFSTGTK